MRICSVCECPMSVIDGPVCDPCLDEQEAARARMLQDAEDDRLERAAREELAGRHGALREAGSK